MRYLADHTRLWQLTRKLGELTDEERKEYERLKSEQSAEVKSAMLKLSERSVMRVVKIAVVLTLLAFVVFAIFIAVTVGGR